MRRLAPVTPLARVLAAALFALPAALPAALPVMAAAVPFAVQVYDRTENRILPTYEFQGRTYVVGRPGNEYALTLRNAGGERVLAVGSVDGVNIITGETASAEQSGYVLSPGQAAEIKGWRKSMSRTAAFFFTEHDNSYAARTGRPNDVGVIGVALYRERVAPPPVTPLPYRYDRNDSNDRGDGYKRERERDDAPASAPAQPQAERSERSESRDSAPAAAGAGAGTMADSLARRAEKSLGTGHGRSEQSETRYTDFQRASSTPVQVVTIYYDTYSSLLAMGVPVWREDGSRYAARKPQPRPFPRDPTLGFVPDPR